MKNRRRLGVLVGLFSVALALSGCTTAEPTGQLPEPITLGGLLILSGEGASWGKATRNGIELAVHDVNEHGGVNGRPLRTVYEDTQSDPKVTLDAYRKLRATGVKLLIGPNWSNQGLPLVDIADTEQTILFSPTLGVKEFNEGSEYLFNTWPHDSLLSEDLATYLYSEGKRKIVIFGAQDVWVKDQTEAVKRRFEALGGTVTLVMEPTVDDKDLTTEVLKTKQTIDADAIVLTGGVYTVGTTYAKRLREAGVTTPLYSMTLDKNIIAAAEGAYDGMIFLTSLTPTAAFAARYEQTYGKPIEIGADSAYDAVMMLTESMRTVGPDDTKAIAEYLSTLTEWDGASGKLKADGMGGFMKPYKVYRVNGTIPEEITS